MQNLLDKPIAEDWRDDKYKHLASNSNEYLDIAIEEGLLSGEKVIKKGVIPDGDSSIVYYIETDSNRYIAKFAVSSGDLLSRKLFFEEWAKQGVKTPKIYKVREVDQVIPYELALIEYIDANTISRTYSKQEVFDKGYFPILGSTLAKMHKAKGKGFRKLKEPGVLVAKFDSLGDELDYDIREKRIDWLVEKGHFGDDIYKRYEVARDILVSDLGDMDPSLCHNDFHPYNIMDTDPITVFDPACSISSPIKDLGGTLGKMILNPKSYTSEAIEQFISSYEDVAGKQSRDVIDAAMLLTHMRMLPRTIVSGEEERVGVLKRLIVS